MYIPCDALLSDDFSWDEAASDLNEMANPWLLLEDIGFDLPPSLSMRYEPPIA